MLVNVGLEAKPKGNFHLLIAERKYIEKYLTILMHWSRGLFTIFCPCKHITVGSASLSASSILNAASAPKRVA